MITVKPVTDARIFLPVLRRFKDNDGQMTVLLAEENGVNLGHAVISLHEKRLSILKLELYFFDKSQTLDENTKWIADLLVRAAVSYAANRNVFVVYGINHDDFNVYRQLGHKIVGDIALIDVIKILGKCDNCKK